MKTELEENTLVEDIRESLIEHEADEEGDAPLVSTRDEQGRFKPKEEPKEEPEAEDAPDPRQAGHPKHGKTGARYPNTCKKKSPAGKRRKPRERNSYKSSSAQLKPLWNGLKSR